MYVEENCSFWNVFGCTEACRSLYLSTQPALNFCFRFLHLVFAWRYCTGLEEILLVLLDMLILLDSAGRCFSRERIAVQLFPFFSVLSLSHVSPLPHRKSLWHHLCAPEVPHQPARELCHLQAHAGGRPLGALPVLQRILWKHLPQNQPWLHPHWGGWAAGTLHWWVQRHLSSHWGQCGLLNPRGASQCLQLWQQPCAAGMWTGLSQMVWAESSYWVTVDGGFVPTGLHYSPYS